MIQQKTDFFIIFFKICKKNQSQKSCKKNQYVLIFFTDSFFKMNFRGVPEWVGLEFGFAGSPSGLKMSKNC